MTAATRSPYQGMFQILRFNHRYYAITLAAVTIAFVLAALIPAPWRALLIAATFPALFWTCSSLLVSHYVYDRSPLYNLKWLADQLTLPPKRWVNIHAGLDETTHLLTALFPSTEGGALDIYDPLEMTERSIAEARHSGAGRQACRAASHLGSVLFNGAACAPAKAEMTLGSAGLTARATWAALPLPARAIDAVFLMFTAHELRRPAARVTFFRELARVLRRDGELALIEHARDWPNFLAFGPGFLHFFSPRSWRQTAKAAGFEVRTEFRLTPFVEVLILRKAI
jgi:SAM-dependent methyltransferase